MHISDKLIINHLQDGIPVADEPFADIAALCGISQDEVVARIQRLLDEGYLSRFGPMYHAQELGGGLTLAAMKIPAEDFERVNQQVNSFDEVAHNYEREHELNMWFVLATKTPQGVAQTIAKIEQTTGYPVYNMPKKEEFYVGLRFTL